MKALIVSIGRLPHVAISLVRFFVIVVLEPFVQILLEFFNVGVEPLPQCYVKEFLFDLSC